MLVALRFYAAGGFQGTVASDENIAIHQCSVSRVLVDVTEAIIDGLGPAWMKFPQTDQEKAAAKRKFYLLCGFSGVIGKYPLCINTAVSDSQSMRLVESFR